MGNEFFRMGRMSRMSRMSRMIRMKKGFINERLAPVPKEKPQSREGRREEMQGEIKTVFQKNMARAFG
jgi:hypothetical protein